ncbi:hypothetical protein KFL_000460035 [Klebsormidium nitens]|uniref:Peroxidase n=1 Tax=Klebsormidium nitens TaxID=105231 RepID=A0A1Y1HSW4_KLENI|nr:hypothetical protein KFL_000460035 [Klebsormidium nitens]|eukprot:GAQ80091.1 hypothetical protein KFL_000460035 [Klebsormidium nitens]
MGMASTRFGKNNPPAFTPASSSELPPDLLNPNPFLVAETLLRRNGGFRPAEGLNLLIPAWLQFNNHDWFNHGRDAAAPPLCLPMGALSDADPLGSAARNGSGTLEQGAECFNLTRTQQSSRPGTFANTVTHWWDASQLYGSDNLTQGGLRTYEGGEICTVKGPFGEDRLPRESETGLPVTGFNDDWWMGLSLMHTLFVKEHNAVAQAIQAADLSLSDEELFQKARLVIAAEIAKIHTLEWMPTILGFNPVLSSGLDIIWHGLSADLPIPSGFDTGILQSPAVRGIADKTYYAGTPFSITEEFAAVSRMHSLLPETITLLPNSTVNGGPANVTVYPVSNTSFAGAEALLDRHSIQEWLTAFGTGTPGALTLNNYPDFLATLVHPTRGSLNMAAIDIVRDRERGVLRYNALRRALRLTPITTFEDLTPNATVVSLLRSVYSSADDVDLLVGCLAEEPRPRGFSFGETAFTLILQMASRLLKTDRFFQEAFTPNVYSQTGIDWVNNATFKNVLLRHFPELAPALAGLPNPFVTCNPFGQTSQPPTANSFLPSAYDVATAKLAARGKGRPGLQNRAPQPLSAADIFEQNLANQPDISFDDLPGNPVVDCRVSKLLAPVKTCLGGVSQRCCEAIDAAFAPGANASTRNCLCLPTVAAAGRQVARGFGVDFETVLSDCWMDYGLQTNWFGEINGHCPAFPSQSDPYTWRALAPNMVVLLLIYWALCAAADSALRRWAPPYRNLSPLKQRNVATYFLEVLVTSAALALTLTYGSDVLLYGRTGSPNVRIGLLLIATLYVFELIYRNETGIPLLLHHLITVLLLVLLVFSSKDNAPSAEARIVQRFGLLISLHASTEQLTFVGLAMYRLGHPWAARVMKISTWQVLVFKLVINALTWVLMIDYYVTKYDDPSASRTSTNWHIVWPFLIPLRNTALFFAQLYSVYIIHVIASQHEGRARALHLGRRAGAANPSGGDTSSGDDVSEPGGGKVTWQPEGTPNEEKKMPAFERSRSAPAAARFARQPTSHCEHTFARQAGERQDPRRVRPRHGDRRLDMGGAMGKKTHFVALQVLLLSFLVSAQGQNSSCASGQLRVRGFAKTLTYVVAEQQGFFAGEGLSLCFTQVTGSIAQFNDFKAGKYDILSSAPDNYINRFVNENLPLQIFAESGESEGITMPVGGTPARVAALVAGQTPTGTPGYGTMVTPAASYDVPRLTNGTCQIIADFDTLWAPRKYSQTAWAADRGLLAANQDTVQRFLRAYIRAGQFILDSANKQATVAGLAQSNGISLTAAQQYFDDSFARYGQTILGKIDKKSIQGVVDLRNMFGGFRVPVDSAALVKESLHHGLITSEYWGEPYAALRA